MHSKYSHHNIGIGPRGPRGEQGPPGATGATGATGQQGVPGTAGAPEAQFGGGPTVPLAVAGPVLGATLAFPGTVPSLPVLGGSLDLFLATLALTSGALRPYYAYSDRTLTSVRVDVTALLAVGVTPVSLNISAVRTDSAGVIQAPVLLGAITIPALLAIGGHYTQVLGPLTFALAGGESLVLTAEPTGVGAIFTGTINAEAIFTPAP